MYVDAEKIEIHSYEKSSKIMKSIYYEFICMNLKIVFWTNFILSFYSIFQKLSNVSSCKWKEMVFFCAWLPMLVDIMSCGSIYVATKDRVPFFFVAEQYSIGYTYYILFMHYFVSGLLGWFLIPTIMNSAAINMQVKMSSQNIDFLFLTCIPISGAAAHITNLCLPCWGTSVLVSVIFTLIYICNNNV